MTIGFYKREKSQAQLNRGRRRLLRSPQGLVASQPGVLLELRIAQRFGNTRANVAICIARQLVQSFYRRSETKAKWGPGLAPLVFLRERFILDLEYYFRESRECLQQIGFHRLPQLSPL